MYVILQVLVEEGRLAKPKKCRQEIYDTMHSCWNQVKKSTFFYLFIYLNYWIMTAGRQAVTAPIAAFGC